MKYISDKAEPVYTMGKNNKKISQIGYDDTTVIDKLFEQVINKEVILQRKEDSNTVEKIEKELNESKLEGEVREAVIKQRVGQDEFRKRLLRRYSKCCLCNVASPELLVASHIKPWSVCNSYEKLDVDNGFLMCPDHDALFDKYLISFDDNGQIIISDKLTKNDTEAMRIRENITITLTQRNKSFLEHHRNIFSEKNCRD